MSGSADQDVQLVYEGEAAHTMIERPRRLLSTRNLALGSAVAVATGLAAGGVAEAYYGHENTYYSGCTAGINGSLNIHVGPERSPSKFSNSAVGTAGDGCFDPNNSFSVCARTKWFSHGGSGVLGTTCVVPGATARSVYASVPRLHAVRAWAYTRFNSYTAHLIGKSHRSYVNY